jgi:SAM-dependent methyltransferase
MRPTTTWGGRGGSFWAANDERYDAMLAPMTPHLLTAAALTPTDRVLDVGCGCGRPSRLAARTAASVLGVDLDEAMIARARERSAGIPNLRFELADAQTATLEPVDVVMSQAGVMFFEDPVAAFTNLRSTGGRLAFLCWQAMSTSEHRQLKRDAMAPWVTIPDPVPGPGALSMADPAVVREVLGAAGYTDIEVTGVQELLPVGTTADDAVEFQLAEPAMADLLAEAGPEAAGKAAEALRQAYKAKETPEGVLLSASGWVVTARSP